jgi:hypothetical protein
MAEMLIRDGGVLYSFQLVRGRNVVFNLHSPHTELGYYYL